MMFARRAFRQMPERRALHHEDDWLISFVTARVIDQARRAVNKAPQCRAAPSRSLKAYLQKATNSIGRTGPLRPL